jgi:hypothetical protein
VNVTEVFNPEPIIEDLYVYYPVKDNRIKVDLDKPQKASLFDYFSRIELINEYVLSWCEHGALENYVSEEMLDENNRQKFRKLLNTREEMNPIIIKYYFQ